MSRGVILGLAVTAAVVAFIAGGYAVGFIAYDPEVERLETQIEGLASDVSSLERTVAGRDARIAALEGHIALQETTIASLQQAISAKEETIASLERQIANLERSEAASRSLLDQATARLDARTEELAALEDAVDAAVITLSYRWHFLVRWWELETDFPLRDYVESRQRQRSNDGPSLARMVTDRRSLPYVDEVIQALDETVAENNLTDLQVLDLVVTFVRALPYVEVNVAAPHDATPRYPVETLVDRAGDSQDASILVAAILDRMGYDVGLVVITDARHVAVGVSLDGDFGTSFEHEGTQYTYLETIQLLGLGTMPAVFLGRDAQVFPVGN